MQYYLHDYYLQIMLLSPPISLCKKNPVIFKDISEVQ